MRGPTEEEVKNKLIDTIPGIRIRGETFLPRINAKKKNKGNNIPKIITGGLI